MIEELSNRIWQNQRFRADYESLLRLNLCRSARVSDGNISEFDSAKLHRLLQSATHFAGCTDSGLREIAYRIATTSWVHFKDQYDSISDVATVVLGRLGNFPAIQFLHGQGLQQEKGYSNLPQPVWMEVHSHQLENSVRLAESEIVLTDFQHHLWSTLASRFSTAITAPTSAGKSFALQHYIANHLLRNRNSWVLYLVPTRALISQVSASVSNVLSQLSVNDVSVTTIPVSREETGATAGIYVLTQERLLFLLETDPKLLFDVAIIDEAQMLAEGSRGIILQTVVENLLRKSPTLQLLFGSPQTSNPSIFGGFFDLEELHVLRETESPVAQNILFLDTNSQAKDSVSVSALLDGDKRVLGQVKVATKLYDTSNTLSILSWHFGSGEKNLVYAGGQAACERIADQISQLSETATISAGVSPAISELSNFIKEHIHSSYTLSETIKSGVAFHYGNIPAIVRKAVEDYFSNGEIDYIVCTSTLLHGVNLPAKNLFLLNPTKGQNTPLSTAEFWNLAGRAGRLGKDFEGNVFLIDVDKWQFQPLDGERDQAIVPAIVSTVLEERGTFIDFLKDKEHASGKSQNAEACFVKLFNEAKRGNQIKSLDKYTIGNTEVRQQLENLVNDAINQVSLPLWITEKNVSISVFRQQEMYDYLVQKIQSDGSESCIPIHPARSWDEAYPSMIRLLSRIHRYFEKKRPTDKSHAYFAPLALKWMRGDTLAMLIDNAFTHLSKTGNPRISTVIRNVMDQVEKDLRFRYVKYTSCYNDLLVEALEATGNGDKVASIPTIPLYLEVGASSQTMISFVAMGLSRTTASILTDISVNKDMTRLEAEIWLKRRNLDTMAIPSICKREIQEHIRV